MRALLSRFKKDNKGAIAIIACLVLTVMVGCGALAVDLGKIYVSQRHLQSAVDLAALEAARNLGNAEEAARKTLEANGFKNIQKLVVHTGRYALDTTISPKSRFSSGVSAQNTNAVKIDVTVNTPLYFGGAIMRKDHVNVNASATGICSEMAAFAIGSRLLSLNGGIANSLLSSLLGGNINLSVMDYNALLGGQIDLLDFLDELAIKAGVQAGTYQQLLNTRVTAGHIIDAAATVAQRSNPASGVGIALNRLLGASNAGNLELLTGTLIQLGELANVGVATGKHGLDAMLNVFDLVRTTAEVANGKNQAAVDLDIAVPGLLGVKATVLIGERMQNSPWISVSNKETIVRTAQTRIRLQVSVGGSGLLSGATIRIPLHLDIAPAEARLKRFSCGKNPKSHAAATLGVKTGVLKLWIAEPNNWKAWTDHSIPPAMHTATLVNVAGLATVYTYAHSSIANLAEQDVHFNASEIASRTFKTVGTKGLLTSLLASTLGDLDLDIKVVGINLGLGTLLAPLLKTLLAPVAGLLDPVLDGLLDLLGIGVGEADVGIIGTRCDGSALAA